MPRAGGEELAQARQGREGCPFTGGDQRRAALDRHVVVRRQCRADEHVGLAAFLRRERVRHHERELEQPVAPAFEPGALRGVGHVDGDHALRAERAGDAHRHRAGQAAVGVRPPADARRLEHSGQRRRRLDGRSRAAAVEDLEASPLQIGCHRGETDRELLDPLALQMRRDEPVDVERGPPERRAEPACAEAEVLVGDDAFERGAVDPRGVQGAGQRADARADDEVGAYAVGLQGLQHAEVREAAQAAAGQHQGQRRCRCRCIVRRPCRGLLARVQRRRRPFEAGAAGRCQHQRRAEAPASARVAGLGEEVAGHGLAALTVDGRLNRGAGAEAIGPSGRRRGATHRGAALAGWRPSTFVRQRLVGRAVPAARKG